MFRDGTSSVVHEEEMKEQQHGKLKSENTQVQGDVLK